MKITIHADRTDPLGRRVLLDERNVLDDPRYRKHVKTMNAASNEQRLTTIEHAIHFEARHSIDPDDLLVRAFLRADFYLQPLYLLELLDAASHGLRHVVGSPESRAAGRIYTTLLDARRELRIGERGIGPPLGNRNRSSRPHSNTDGKGCDPAVVRSTCDQSLAKTAAPRFLSSDRRECIARCGAPGTIGAGNGD